MSSEETNVDGKFNITLVYEALSASLIENADVNMDNYLKGYRELLKFFQLMGSVFSFVSSDVKSKIEILQQFRNGSEKENFVTLKQMIQYEVDGNLLKKSNYISGSRTFLRLHRGLDFITLFLERVSKLENKEKTTAVCQSAYDETLANHHTFLVRKGARVAMYALPTREGLLEKVCGSLTEVETALNILPKMLTVAKEVHSRSNCVYDEFNLHELP